MRFIYLDTSAALKLFKQEHETSALKAWLSTEGSATVLTCDLTRTEVRRALHAANAASEIVAEAEDWLEESALIRIPANLFDRAGLLCPGTRLRSLDALHLAAASGLGRALIAFVAYDKRLVESAESLGLPVKSPSPE
ncbi:type II toxin-antitoxin system VapC family toxin [Streptomyces himalayensis]|uniref:Ribonuclease VapC n=1 Tax=Streptomyces himalayensis subsp. himalayensis TaxID=2756131 RepID=A0A7W0I9C0_9ACTN|nr:type II toxin-antitoxin system VapC family toxin [Streptomyces himalayensis]MBA2947118.1 type II toxin-antitoxin system VapC family toxin [Streptomyces himalayensis subsp. himalayensis]